MSWNVDDSKYWSLALEAYRKSTGDETPLGELPVHILSKLARDAHALLKQDEEQ